MSTLTVSANQCDLCGYVWLPSGKPSIQCPKCRKRGWHKSGWQMSDLSSLELKIDPKMHMMGDWPDTKPDMAALRAICAGEHISIDPDRRPLTLDDYPAQPEIPMCRKERWQDGQKAICGKDKGHQLDHGLWVKVNE